MNKLKNIECPIQMVYSSEDIMFTLEDGIEIKSKLVGSKDISLVSIPNCGHFVHLEEPELVSEKLMSFV